MIKHIFLRGKQNRAEHVFLVEWLYHRCVSLLLSNIFAKQASFWKSDKKEFLTVAIFWRSNISRKLAEYSEIHI